MSENKKKIGGRRKVNIVIAVCLAAALLAGGGWTLAKYVFFNESDTIAVNKNFYFTSGKLADTTAEGTVPAQYSLSWLSSVNSTLAIDVDLKNYKYLNTHSESDIDYSITASVVEAANAPQVAVDVDASGTPGAQGVLLSDDNDVNTHTVVLSFTAPASQTDIENDRFTVRVTARSESPYKVELSAEFTVFLVEGAVFSYEVEDNVGDISAELVVTVPSDINPLLLDGDGMISLMLDIADTSVLIPDRNDSRITYNAETDDYTIRLASGSIGHFPMFKLDAAGDYSSGGPITDENPYEHLTLEPVVVTP